MMKRSLPFYSLLFSLCIPVVSKGQTTDRIRVNQVGYSTQGSKLTAVTGKVSANKFYITSTNYRDTFYAGILSPAQRSKYSATDVSLADFSSFFQKGSFVLLVPGMGSSYVFRIDNGVFQDVAVSSLKGFYFQRMSMPLEPQYAGKWHRGTGHPDDVVYVHASAATDKRPEGTVIASPGGWYDAGDYNKYIVNSGITMGTLLAAYEDFPQLFVSLKTNIPESGNHVPDLLDEILYNLRWMFTMQDPDDGGVYHKCTNAVFDGMVMPGVTKEKRYVVQKSTAAALDFSAVMAQSARVFRHFEKELPGLADSCLTAAKYAWYWAEKNPKILYDQTALNKKFAPEVTTGAYGDRTVNDEWLWAAAELFATTKENPFYKVLLKRIYDKASLPSWSNVGLLGYYTLIRQQKQLPPFSQPLVEKMKDSVLQLANEFIKSQKENAFATVMGQSLRDFIWGSNAVAANQGILLIHAFKIKSDVRYQHGALSNFDYLLGRNATGYSFLTGMGSKTPMHPHHRQSEADGVTEPVPGLLVGGPNPGMQDQCHYPFHEPERAYVDEVCSYASNEIAINWNAPLVYLAGALQALNPITHKSN